MCPAGGRHGIVAENIADIVKPHVKAQALGRMPLADTGYFIARDPDVVRAPDLAFIARDRMPDHIPDGFFEIPPDLAIEIVSPGDRYQDVLEKAAEYLDHGVREVWIVYDPRRIEVLRQGENPFVVVPGMQLETPLLPGLSIAVADVFAP